jgi:hypothetical protein
MFRAILVLLSLVALARAAIVDPLTAYGLDASAELRREDVTGDGGIVKIVLVEGTGAKAQKGATISAH